MGRTELALVSDGTVDWLADHVDEVAFAPDDRLIEEGAAG